MYTSCVLGLRPSTLLNEFLLVKKSNGLGVEHTHPSVWRSSESLESHVAIISINK